MSDPAQGHSLADEGMMTVAEVAERLKMSDRWVCAAADRGEIPCARFGNRRRFLRADVDDLIRRNREQARQPPALKNP